MLVASVNEVPDPTRLLGGQVLFLRSKKLFNEQRVFELEIK